LTLSAAQRDTLRDLLRKKHGAAVGWISIALARGLTDLGLAEREPSGWRITAAGEAMLERQADAAETSVAVLQFPPCAPPDAS
jgi:ribosomal protein S19E (S16A)